MGQNAHEMLVQHIFELFDTGEEALAFLNEHGLRENQYLLGDLETVMYSHCLRHRTALAAD